MSDGVSVTITDAEGRFSITPLGPFVFITRPAGWTCQRWFVPVGEPSVTFRLTPAPDVFPYRFAHLSDTHVSVATGVGGAAGAAGGGRQPLELGERGVLSRLLAHVPEHVPDVSSVIVTGDLTELGLDAEFDALRAAVSASPLPVHLVPGNHDHMAGRATDILSPNNYVINAGDPAGYERNIGPRWYSFDLPGLHVVAVDWHTHELGLDDRVQNAWLRADLESTPAGIPWILLSHDQPWTTMLQAAPRPPLATFSGHRHASRVIDVDGTLHVTTPTPLFAGLDFTPASYRVVTWDGERVSLRTRLVADANEPSAGRSATRSAGRAGDLWRRRTAVAAVRWRRHVPAAAHGAAVSVCDGLVLAAVAHEDGAGGGVRALSLIDGSTTWHARLDSAVKGAPTVATVGGEPLVFATEVAGDTVALGLRDGAVRWRASSPDPLRSFAWTQPTVADGVVIVGDLSRLRGLDAATGELVWERADLLPYQTQIAHAAPVVAGDVVVVGPSPAPNLFGLDARTGAIRWPQRRRDYDFDALVLADSARATPLYDPVSGTLYVAATGRLIAVDAETGRTRWSVPLSLRHAPSTPAATEAGIAVVDAGQGIRMLARDDGVELWRHDVSGDPPFALASYRRTPHPMFAGPTAVRSSSGGELVVAPGLDGLLHIVRADDGEEAQQIDIGAPVAAPVTVEDGLALVVDVTGRVVAVDLAAQLGLAERANRSRATVQA